MAVPDGSRPDRTGPADIRYDDGMAVLVVASGDAPDRLGAAVAALRGRVVACMDWTDAPAARVPPQVVAMEASGVAEDLLAERLPPILDWARSTGAGLVLAIDAGQIDMVAAPAMESGTALLVDASVADCAAALAIAAETARIPAGVFDMARESDALRLERLNAEVARIADALARLSREESERNRIPPFVGDPGQGYAGPPNAAAPTAADIRRAIRARRLRDHYFGPALFEDPGWDMLLDLYAAQLEHGRVSVSSLCIAAAVAPTTALRWIGRMTDAGLMERRPDPSDRRRAFMALTARASDAMYAYWIQVRRAEMNIA